MQRLSRGRCGVALALLVAACGGGSGAGDRWQPQAIPEIFSLNAVWAFAPDDVWAVGSQGKVLAWDGSGWTASQIGVTGDLTGIWAFARNDVWVTSDSQVTRWNGSAWTVTELGGMGVNGFTDIWGSSPTDVWVVGDDAVFLHFDGAQWRRVTAVDPFNHAVWGTDPNNVWAMSVFGVSRWDGATWTDVDNGHVSGEGDIFGFGPSDVWTVGDSEEAAHFDGAAWKIHETNFIGQMGALWGAASNDLWSAGGAGSIGHWNGSHWTEVAHQTIGSPYLRYFLGIHGSGPDDVWAVGHQLGETGSRGIIYHYTP